MATKTSNTESLSAENKETDKSICDEKQEAASDAIDWNEKGLESFNKYIKHIFAEIEKNGGSKKYGFLQLCSVVELLEKCQKSGIIDENVDLCDIEEDEEEFTKLINSLTLKSYVDNMEYLIISEKMGKGIEEVSAISCMILNNYGYENTHTGNCKADEFEKIVKKIQRLIKKQDYESYLYKYPTSFFCLLAFLYYSLFLFPQYISVFVFAFCFSFPLPVIICYVFILWYFVCLSWIMIGV